MKCARNKLGVVCTALLFAVAVAMPLALVSTDAAAQEITASIHGTVLKPDGTPAVGALAVVTDSRDGRRQTGAG